MLPQSAVEHISTGAVTAELVQTDMPPTSRTPSSSIVPAVRPVFANAEASSIPAPPDCLNPALSSTEGGDDGGEPGKTETNTTASTVDTLSSSGCRTIKVYVYC